jgi:hypothetical protein
LFPHGGKESCDVRFSLRHFASGPARAARRHRKKHPACEAAHGGRPRADGPSGIGAGRGRGAPKGKGADDGDERATRDRLRVRASGSPVLDRQLQGRDPSSRSSFRDTETAASRHLLPEMLGAGDCPHHRSSSDSHFFLLLLRFCFTRNFTMRLTRASGSGSSSGNCTDPLAPL